MKIYHKFLLYQNKWIHPYVRMTVGVMTSITYLASILLIVGVVYEHGFTISEVEAHQLQRLYHGVWIVFLVDVTLRILLEYKDTRRTFSKLTWILTILLYLTLSRSFSIVRRRRAPSCSSGNFCMARPIILSCCWCFPFSAFPTGWYGCWGGVRTLRLFWLQVS